MRVQLVSDLHCEMYHDGGLRMLDELPVAGDVLVVAGDLADHEHLADALGWLCNKFYEVVYVPGNHEYYFSNREAVTKTIQELALRHSNFHPLDGNVVEIGGQRFIGATGWFPDTPNNWAFESQLNDFRLIRNAKKWIYPAHEEHRKFLLENVRFGDFVVTHHAPTALSTPPRFKDSQLNRFYVAQFQDVVVKCQPKIWAHGHMHEPCDYGVMDCRVVANPKGYPRERQSFDASFTVDI